MKKLDKGKIIQAKCNKCGKDLKIQNGMIVEGAVSIKEKWGYFSTKDLEQHSFDLCEDCYDQIISEFNIPIEIKEYITIEEMTEN